MKITKWDLFDGELSVQNELIILAKSATGKIVIQTDSGSIELSKKDAKQMLMEAVFWIESV